MTCALLSQILQGLYYCCKNLDDFFFWDYFILKIILLYDVFKSASYIGELEVDFYFLLWTANKSCRFLFFYKVITKGQKMRM
jgi:hypothetical protein